MLHFLPRRAQNDALLRIKGCHFAASLAFPTNPALDAPRHDVTQDDGIDTRSTTHLRHGLRSMHSPSRLSSQRTNSRRIASPSTNHRLALWHLTCAIPESTSRKGRGCGEQDEQRHCGLMFQHHRSDAVAGSTTTSASTTSTLYTSASILLRPPSILAIVFAPTHKIHRPRRSLIPTAHEED
ncbi:hypothetical protein MSAN_02285700 [Mycena sanguinolenta]|uniref:Uncharacterized protein n=1 Tax=Mycena sanguinolenta TaxID=230812 RepID=A0A8H7CHH8_9AGAR|nr:hypothetical protein MSAN_02285700 [Mycena sanguinolenta]